MVVLVMDTLTFNMDIILFFNVDRTIPKAPKIKLNPHCKDTRSLLIKRLNTIVKKGVFPIDLTFSIATFDPLMDV